VAFFLAGLMVLGGLQQWWLQPIVSALLRTALFFGAAALTAVTDNAALTYLGSLIVGTSGRGQVRTGRVRRRGWRSNSDCRCS
jgi:hypothetical protein